MADLGPFRSEARTPLESRRDALLAIGAAAILPGCANLRKSAFWGTILNATQPVGAKIDRVKIESIPYASMIANFRGSATALLVLGEYLPEDRLVWYSAERQNLTTWGPYVVRLLGIEVALRAMVFHGDWSTNVTEMVGRKAERSFEWQAERGGLFSANAISEFRDEGIDVVEILGERHQLRRVRELLAFNGRHHFSNYYWVDPITSLCWKSRQVVVPTLPAFELQIGRRPIGN